MNIGVVGLWHLGCTLSACWSDLGHAVIATDQDKDTVRKLRNGIPPVFDPGLEEILKKNLRKGSLEFSEDMTSLKVCDAVFLSYDTPVLEDDESDLTPLKSAIKLMGPLLKDEALVIVSSQTPVGTCSKFRKSLKTANKTLELVYSPENIRLGEALSSYMRPGRIILGSEDAAARNKFENLFSPIHAEILNMNLSSAEMVKHGINSFLALSVTYANQLADLCESSGADILEVIRGMKSDPRIGERAYLTAGIGFSGGTLGRDLKVLQKMNGEESLFETVIDLNHRRKNELVKKMASFASGGIKGCKVGILGLTYKPGTSTLRRSLPVEIVKLLLEKGAEVSVYDPRADYSEMNLGAKWLKKLHIVPTLDDVIKNSGIVAILTEWPEIINAPWRKLLNEKNPQILFDPKNCLSKLELKSMGYLYHGTGRAHS